jgi:hypothetical protein
METSNVYRVSRDRISANQPAPTAGALSSAQPRLLDQARLAIRTRHYSYMTEKAYIGWIKRFIFLVLLGFLWIHVQFPAEEQNRYPVVLKFPEPSCC